MGRMATQGKAVMLCSFLIPSRARFERLLSSVDSILRTSSHENIEILVRLDNDDFASISRLQELRIRGVRVVIGDRLKGHASLHDFYNELAEIATGNWVFFLNDDITLETFHPNWTEQLKPLPLAGILACGKWYQLGLSRYDAPAVACPIVPNKCWLKLGWERIPSCVDEAFLALLIKQHGWSIVPLPSLTVNHQRDDDEQLRAHRLMGKHHA